ncbi:MAG: serine/threonine-protein phosphatase [Oscillospiraceae bacterium]|nr:serine/threonine-protein phosphatase [Oscillospiraceae bacterium]
MEKVQEHTVNPAKKSLSLPSGVTFIFLQLLCLAAGFGLGRTKLFGCLPSFAVSFAAAMPGRFLLAAVLGGAVGAVSTADELTAMILGAAAVAAAGAINRAASRLTRLRETHAFSFFAALLCCAATGLTVQFAGGFSVNAAVLFLCEGVLSGGAAYFLSRSMSLASMLKNNVTLSAAEVSGFMICACILLTSLSTFSFSGIMPARILASLLILTLAFVFRETGGAIAGVCMGAALELTTGPGGLAGAMSLGGLIGGVFANVGQIPAGLAYVALAGLYAVITRTSGSVAVLTESAAAAVLFIAVPKRYPLMLKRFFRADQLFAGTAPKKASADSSALRLRAASDAIADVSTSVQKFSSDIKRFTEPDVKNMYASVRENVCAGCGLNAHCWSNCRDETALAFESIASLLRRNDYITPEQFDPSFQERCVCKREIAGEFLRAHRAALELRASSERVGQIREVVADQFGFVSDILSDMSAELEHSGQFSFAKSKKVSEALRSFGIDVSDVTCFEDKHGRLMITALARNFDPQINKSKLAAEAGKAAGRRLCIPCVSENGGGCVVSFSQESEYRTRVGAVQTACDGDGYCGDFFEIWGDGHGRHILVLSDGMGTGGRAAADAEMTTGLFCDLVRAGISFDCALRIVNSALLVKGADESLSTLDVTCVDLYSGRAEFMKAGGAATFVRKKNKAARLELSALPAGILRDIEFEKASAELSAGDIIVMVSDGALSGSDAWLLSELKNYGGSNAQELADMIAEQSRKRRGKTRGDDVTVLCCILDARR